MQYPLLEKIFSEELTLFIPDPEKIKPHYEDLLAKNPSTPFPFWAKLWTSARALTRFLHENPQWTTGKKVLEIGAGIGFPSFHIADRAEEITISDYDPEAVALIQKNIEQLGLTNAKALCLDWSRIPDSISVDTVLLSDINYAPEQFESLLDLIRHFLEADTTIILATPERIIAKSFVKQLEGWIRYSALITPGESEGDGGVRVLVLQG